MRIRGRILEWVKTRRRKLITRILQRLLSPGRGEVRAMEQALQIEGILRFVGLFALMVLVPAILLAWYGLGSIRVEELGLDQEVSLDAADRSERVISNLQDDVLSFEQRVGTNRIGSIRWWGWCN